MYNVKWVGNYEWWFGEGMGEWLLVIRCCFFFYEKEEHQTPIGIVGVW
jgi:hypothetical protein